MTNLRQDSFRENSSINDDSSIIYSANSSSSLVNHAKQIIMQILDDGVRNDYVKLTLMVSIPLDDITLSGLFALLLFSFHYYVGCIFTINDELVEEKILRVVLDKFLPNCLCDAMHGLI